MALLEITQRLLSDVLAAEVNLRQIAAESNGTVSHEWLKKFAAGKIEDPGVNRIQSLHDTLKSIKSKAARRSVVLCQ
jgi:hypothetical protein